jgi:ABC-type spermidine/putrescine transport system permease subunit I
VNQPEDVNQSDRESIDSGASINDEMRQLKDFKALISEKTEPKYIKILKRTVWLLIAIMITITAVILGYRI